MRKVTVNVLKFGTPKLLTKWHMQTVQTQIRLRSDQGLHYLPFPKYFKITTALKAKITPKNVE